MRVTWTAGSVAALGGIALLALASFVLYLNRDALTKWAGKSFNPTNSENLAYRGANEIVTNIAGRSETVGGFLWEKIDGLFGGKNAAIEEMKKGTQPIPSNGVNYTP